MVEEGRETDTDRSQADEESGSDGLSPQTPALKELVEFLARNLVTKPEAVEVTEHQSDNTWVLELHVHKEDLGRVIGKQGRTAKSLRTIINAAASRANCKASLEIVEE